MNTITSIDTLYRGCYFRSRLEARYALLFDLLKIAWRYEPEPYRVGPDRQPYLPDFYLPRLGTWVEVKGDEADFTEKADLYSAACHPETGLAGIADSILTTRGFLILGPIPEIKPNSLRPLHTLIQHGEFWDEITGIHRVFAAFADDGHLVGTGFNPAHSVAAGLPVKAGIQWTATVRAPGPNGPNGVAMAYTVARAARFDRGPEGLHRSITAAIDRFKDDLYRTPLDSGPDAWERWDDTETVVSKHIDGRLRRFAA